ncbi:MAG: MmcQ/YjbR family DNA-binding protein [Pyrinomonadaceae bacterium]
MDKEELRDLCLSFPHATEDIKWEKDLCFLVGGKMFAATGLDESEAKVSFKCTPEKFAELTEREGIIPAPYVARYHWIAVEDPNVLSEEEYEDLISRSYLLVYENLPLKQRKELGKK